MFPCKAAFTVFFSLVMSVPMWVHGQDSLMAHFPLRADGNEITEKVLPMLLANAPFVDSSLYSNGLYSGEGAPVVLTPVLPVKLFKAFTVSVQFKVDTLPLNEVYKESPILMGGPSWRWMGAIIRSDSTLAIRYNNSSTKTSKTRYAFHTWQEVTMTYDSLASLGILYLNNVPVCSASFVINYGNAYEAVFSPTNYANGTVYKGYLRELKVYSGVKRPTTGKEQKQLFAEAGLFSMNNSPNPFTTQTEIRYSLPSQGTVRIALYEPTGKLVQELVHKNSEAGSYRTVWHPEAVAKGVYLCQMQFFYRQDGKTKTWFETRKLLLQH